MANHVRLQIRDAVVTAVTGLATTGANVFKSAVYDLERLTLPALVVRVGNETSAPVTLGAPRRYERDCDIDVEACAEDNADCDATLIGIAQQVEEALAMPLSGPWKVLTLVASAPRLEGGAQKVRGRLVLRYRANYLVREDAPDTAL